MDFDLVQFEKFKTIIGCDEVGRGPIAGPVNACAVRISTPNILKSLLELKVTDSKKLTDKKREKILAELRIDVESIELDKVYVNNFLGEEFSFIITEHDHEAIDQMNILQASLSAMKNASDNLVLENSKVLVDGNKTFESSSSIEAVVKGDSKSIVIGLASIIAKVYRDQKMKTLDKKYPGYNLGKHAGYPTKEHRCAVEQLGPSPIHRKTFKGVKEFL